MGLDVIAPISSIIIDIENSEENILPNIEKFVSSLENYIFMEIKETKPYLILAHLEKNSINLKIGAFLTQCSNFINIYYILYKKFLSITFQIYVHLLHIVISIIK